MSKADTKSELSHIAPPTILIVEDEVIVAMLLKEQLEQLGYRVSGYVMKAEEALRRIEEDKPDLVLMDITLPGSMDGIEAAELVQSRFHIPVVFSTGHSDEETIRRAKAVLPFGFLVKPYRNSELKVAVDLALYANRADALRRAEEERLRANGRTLSALLNVPYAQFMLLDRQGRILSMNRPAMDQLGKDVSEVRGKPAADFLSPEPSELRRAKAREVLATGRPVHFEDHVFQRILETDIFPVFSQGDTVSQLAVFWRDVTKEKEATRALRDAERKYRALVENVFEGILVLLDGRIVFHNPKAVEILEYPSDGLHGTPLLELVHPEDRNRMNSTLFPEDDTATVEEEMQFRFLDRHGSEQRMETRRVWIPWEAEKALMVILRPLKNGKTSNSQVV